MASYGRRGGIKKRYDDKQIVYILREIGKDKSSIGNLLSFTAGCQAYIQEPML